MNSVQLENMLKKDPVTSDLTLGVFPVDKIPKKIKKPCCFIANISDSSSPGTHWVAFFLPEKGSGEYFDSFGLPPKKKRFLSFLKKNCETSWVYSNRRLQGNLSTVCGQYALLFLLHRARGVSMQMFLDHFSGPAAVSDQYVNDLINDFYSTDFPVTDTGFLESLSSPAI